MPDNIKYKKVLLIGIDGMDPGVTERLIEEGKLPNFQKLAEEGTFINLNTSYPPHSPVAWTSIATGSNPGKHNIFDFIRRTPGSYIPELSLSKSEYSSSLIRAGTKYSSYVKADPFWRILSNSGVKNTIIRWPVSFPPEKIEGSMLSGLGVPDIKGLLSGYTYYTENNEKGDKIKIVENHNGLIGTEITGPKTIKSGDLINLESPMQIKIKNETLAELTVQGKSYLVETGKWSDWIEVGFKIDFLRKSHGIFRAYLLSTNPFEMYTTTIQIDPENPIVDISYPKKYSQTLADEIGLYYTLGMPEETDGFVDGKINETSFLEQVNQIETERDKMFWKEFENFKSEKTGALAFVYDSSDRVQHVFCDTKILSGNDTINKNVEDYFMKKDEFMGKVMSQIDNETLLLIISDHGFTSFERAVSINDWLVENGFMTLTKELGKGEDGALFQYVDWSKTKAYSLGFNSVYINLKGREKEGIVENKEEVINEIIEKLESLEDEENGKKPIFKVYKNEDIYKGDYSADGPDMIIGFNPGYRMAWQTAIGGFSNEVVYNNTKIWDGDHLVDPAFVPGVLFSNIKLNITSASQMDVAPTVLDALGVEVPESMDGKSLFE